MLPSQLAPFELVYLDQRGNEIPVAQNEQRICFDTFTQLVDHLRTHPDFEVKDHSKLGVGFELLEQSTTELVGVMAYSRTLGDAHMKTTSFKVRGPFPDLSATGWFIDFTL